MRICLVSMSGKAVQVLDTEGPHGGAEVQTRILAEGLVARGHEVSLVLTDFDPAVDTGRSPGVALIPAYDRRHGIPGLRFLPRWRALHRALGRADAEAYYQMCAGPATGQVAFFCRRRNRRFVFATASDADVVPGRIRLGFRDRRVYLYGLRRADLVLTQHAGQREALRRRMGIPSTVLGSGVPIPEAIHAPEHPPVVLWLGSLRAVKRPEAWLDLAPRFPGARFVMIGGPAPGEDELFASVTGRAREMPNVTVLGRVPSVEPVLSRAWVLVNTSESEGFPVAFLEAWAHGVPTVSRVDPGGVITAHEIGLVSAEPGEALARILESPETRDRLGAAARGYVETHHHPDRILDGLESALRGSS